MPRILLVSTDSRLVDQVKVWSKELGGEPELVVRDSLFERRIKAAPVAVMKVEEPGKVDELPAVTSTNSTEVPSDSVAASHSSEMPVVSEPAKPQAAKSESFDLILIDLEGKSASELGDLKKDLDRFRESAKAAQSSTATTPTVNSKTGPAANSNPQAAGAIAVGAETESALEEVLQVVGIATPEIQLEGFSIRELHLTDVLFKPLERTLFLQKVEIYLAGQKPISFSFLFSQKTNILADIANDIEITHFSETHLAVTYPVKINLGVFARIYLDTFNNTDRSWVWAKVRHVEKHPSKQGYYITSFLLFGLTSKQLFAIRTRIKDEKSKHRHPVRFNFDKTTDKANEEAKAKKPEQSRGLTQMAKAHAIISDDNLESFRPVHVGIVSMERKTRDEIRVFMQDLNIENTFTDFSNLLSFCKRVAKMKLVPVAAAPTSSMTPALEPMFSGIEDTKPITTQSTQSAFEVPVKSAAQLGLNQDSADGAPASSNSQSDSASNNLDTDDVLDLESLADMKVRLNDEASIAKPLVDSTRPASGPLAIDEQLSFFVRLPTLDVFQIDDDGKKISLSSRTLFGDPLTTFLQDPSKLNRAMAQMNSDESKEFWLVVSQGQRGEVRIDHQVEKIQEGTASDVKHEASHFEVTGQLEQNLSTSDSPVALIQVRRLDSNIKNFDHSEEPLLPIDLLFIDVALLGGEDRDNRLQALSDAVQKVNEGRPLPIVIGTYEEAAASSRLFSGAGNSHSSWVDGFRSAVMSSLISLPLDKRVAKETLSTLVFHPQQFMPVETYESKSLGQIAKVCDIVEISEFGFKLRSPRAVRPGVLLHFHAGFLKAFDPHGIRIHSVSSAAVEGASPGAAAFDSFFVFYGERDDLQKLIRSWILKEFVQTKTEESA